MSPRSVSVKLTVEHDEDALNICPECSGNRDEYRVLVNGSASGEVGRVIFCPHCEVMAYSTYGGEEWTT